MIINKDIKVKNYDPYIKTEETIFNLIIRDKGMISDDYELMPYPLALWINTIGIAKTNKILSSIKSNKIRVFVCQHILVNNLSFIDSDIVFTPHSHVNDRFITIPHYAVNIDPKFMIEDRSIEFSFIGSIQTHITRKQLIQMYPDCHDSKVYWALDLNTPKELNDNYIKLLGDTKFSLCPRGTGISSVRLFESMAMGSIPVIIGDGYEPPLSDIIKWSDISISIPEDKINDIPNILSNYSYNLMRVKMLNIYNEYFNNEKLHKTIIRELR